MTGVTTFAIETCFIERQHIGRCCNVYEHPTASNEIPNRPGASYAVLLDEEGSLVEHLACWECAADLRTNGEWWDGSQILAIKTYHPREKGHSDHA